MNQTLLLTLIAAGSSVLTVLLPKLLPSSRKKDAVDLDYVPLPDDLTQQIRTQVWSQIKQ